MNWNQKEINEYETTRIRNNSVLNNWYIQSGIPSCEPEERAKYLAENLKLTAIDQEVLTRTASKDGRAKALNMLEQIAIKLYD